MATVRAENRFVSPGFLSLPYDRLRFIHYSCRLWEECQADTPSVLAIVVLEPATARCVSFAAYQIAERRGIPAAEIPARFPELERALLRQFYKSLFGRKSFRSIGVCESPTTPT
jgi:hypothetical protein